MSFWGYWYPCFGFLSDITSQFQAGVGYLIHIAKANVMYIPCRPVVGNDHVHTVILCDTNETRTRIIRLWGYQIMSSTHHPFCHSNPVFSVTVWVNSHQLWVETDRLYDSFELMVQCIIWEWNSTYPSRRVTFNFNFPRLKSICLDSTTKWLIN